MTTGRHGVITALDKAVRASQKSSRTTSRSRDTYTPTYYAPETSTSNKYSEHGGVSNTAVIIFGVVVILIALALLVGGVMMGGIFGWILIIPGMYILSYLFNS